MDFSNSHRSYKIGIYVRESRDDNEEKYETIETQRDLLIDFVERNKLGEICSVYLDDNVSGSGFERKGIEKLKNDIIIGKIDLLVLKDLSRLGRNNAKTLMFLDFLEENGVRVITYDGRYDSLRDNDTVGIDTWYNERYIRDISKKIRANLRFKISKGEYIGHAPYGYIKSPVQKNRLSIDENTAPIVKLIYSLYLQGYGYSSIAKMLNEKRYPSPSNKNHTNTDLYTSGTYSSWNAVAIQRILCNRVYIGDTTQGISEKVSFKSKKTRRLPESSWVITTNTHEPIISRAEFEEVQKIRAEKRVVRGPAKGKIHPFRGIIYCGRCGSVMFARERQNRPMSYICGKYSKGGKSACSSHHISESIISRVVTRELLNILDNPEIRSKLEDSIQKELYRENSDISLIKKLEQQINAKHKQQEILYMDKLEGKISQELFDRMNLVLESKLETLRHELGQIQILESKEINSGEIINSLIDDINKNEVSYDYIKILVKKILIFDKNDYVNDIILQGTSSSDKFSIGDNGLIVIYFNFMKLE